MSRFWRLSRQCLSGGSLSLFAQPPSSSTLWRRFPLQHDRRQLVTLAIETSCDDTCVAVLEKTSAGVARLHFNEKVTSDNRAFRGVHPLTAVVSHTKHLAPLVRRALLALPEAAGVESAPEGGSNAKTLSVEGCLRSKPDFVSVTRGPGMLSNLATGLNVAKGLAVAWDVPLLAVNHMQAHALTPQLVDALEDNSTDEARDSAGEEDIKNGTRRSPEFPFLSLLVSGGHTILVRSNSLTDHTILAKSMNIAVGDMLDKCARMIIPPEILSADGFGSGMYGPLLEDFAFPGSRESADYDYKYTPPARRADEIKPFDSGHGWTLTPSLADRGISAASDYEFAGLNGQVQKLVIEHPNMDVDMRRVLARATMTLVFEHLTSRLVWALQNNHKTDTEIRTIVLSGGVASNKYLRHVVRRILDVRGYAGGVEVVAPPVALCTDNAAMIAWTAMEMYEQGWRSDLDVLALRKWPLDPNAEGGGILGAPGWYRVPVAEQ